MHMTSWWTGLTNNVAKQDGAQCEGEDGESLDVPGETRQSHPATSNVRKPLLSRAHVSPGFLNKNDLYHEDEVICYDCSHAGYENSSPIRLIWYIASSKMLRKLRRS